jgi:hypothetical protein
MAMPLVLHKAEFLSIGTLLSRLNLGSGRRRRFVFEKGSKFAVVALAVLAIGMPLLYSAPTSQLPNQPSNISPTAGATGVSLTPTLQSSDFSDPHSSDTHAASQWQVATSSCFCGIPTFDSGTDTTNLTSITIPPARLNYDTTYYWHVRHQDNHGSWSEWSEETSFTTQSAPPTIFYSPSSLNFTATAGGANPADQTLSIWNSGGGSLNWSASEDVIWLSLDPISGSSTDEHDSVTVSVNISGLTADTYNATITITAEGATNTPQTVPVSLTISSPTPEPAITYSPSGFSFTATKDEVNPDDQTLEIWSSGDGTLNWSVSEDATWLSLDPTSGSSTGEHGSVTVSVNISGMTAGSYSATITISAPGATNTPQTVSVSLTIEQLNQPPNPPSNILPAAGATGVSLTPTLSSPDFSDPDPGDTHAASQWQVATSSCFCGIPTFDSGRDTTNLTSITIPAGKLNYDTTYYWHVRHQDNQGEWSNWSAVTSFTTQEASN